jgi:hypothetical protein
MKWRFVDTLQHQAARTSRPCLVAPFLDKDRGFNIGENDANLLLGQLPASSLPRNLLFLITFFISSTKAFFKSVAIFTLDMSKEIQFLISVLESPEAPRAVPIATAKESIGVIPQEYQ